MSAQLGVADGLIPSDYSSSWAVNKLGGFPDWLLEGCSVPTCDVCHRNMYLVLQIYCPLKSSEYHRVLYVFTCINRPCWNTPHSWSVLRSQLVDGSAYNNSSCVQAENKMADKGGSTNTSGHSEMKKEQWCEGSDDWGVGADDWGVGADDWGVGADDWGDGADNSKDGAEDSKDGAEDSKDGAEDCGCNASDDERGDDITFVDDGAMEDLGKGATEEVAIEENNTTAMSNTNEKETLDCDLTNTDVLRTEKSQLVTDDLNCAQNCEMGGMDSWSFRHMNNHELEESPSQHTTSPMQSTMSDHFRHVHIHEFEESPPQNTSGIHFRNVNIHEFEETPPENTTSDHFRHMHIHEFEETPPENTTSDHFRHMHIHEFEETPPENTTSDHFRHMHIHEFEETPPQNTTSDQFKHVHIHEFEETPPQNTSSDSSRHMHIHEFEETPPQNTSTQHFRDVHIHEFEETPVQNTSDNFKLVNIHEFEESPPQNPLSDHFRHVHIHEFEETPPQNTTSDSSRQMHIHEFEETPPQNTCTEHFRDVHIQEFEETPVQNTTDNFRHANIHEFEESPIQNTTDNFKHVNIHEFEESPIQNTTDNFKHVNIHEFEESPIQNTTDNFRHVNIHEFEESAIENTSDIVTSENVATSEENVKNMFSTLATSPDQSQSTQPSSGKSDWLVPYFLCVIDEPANEEVDRHVTKLLKAYIQKTGENMEFIDDENISNKSRHGGKSGSLGEKYEKTNVKHGDRCFHRFLKRLSLYPQQVVRYDLHGYPLLVSEKPADQFKVPACTSCGGPMTFELQLVPPLISLLRLPDNTDPVTEFGSVLIYTCERSCWSDEVKVRQEVTFVQPDPDQHLFRF